MIGTLFNIIPTIDRLKAYENRVLRRMFGRKRDEETGGWRKLHEDEFRYLYAIINIKRPIKAMHTTGRLGEMRNAYTILAGCPEETGYGLYDRAIEVRCPAEAKDFSSSVYVQTGSGAHPHSPGLKRGRGVTLTTHPHLVLRSRMINSHITSSPKRLRGV
jgi:hypothetical protein